MNEETKNCYMCGNSVNTQNGVQHGRYFYCDDCFRACKCDVDAYHHPSIDTTFKSLDNEDTKLYLGFELEHTLGSGYFYNNEHLDSTFYIRKNYKELGLNFETDNSIGNGFEIISQPMTMAYINEHKENFRDILEFEKQRGYYSHDKGKCGLHIHVSRDFLGDTEEEIQKTIEKIMLFVETYQDKVEIFSRRKHNQFSPYNSYTKSSYKTSFYNDDNILIEDNYFKSGKMLYELNKMLSIGHSSVVNTSTSTGKTIEFRMFRGTLKYETFMASLEFIYNLVNVCKENQASKISWNKVINYSGEFIKDYVESLNIIDDGMYLRDYTRNIEEIIEKNKAPQKLIIENYKKDLNDITTLFKEIFNEEINILTESAKLVRHTYSFRSSIASTIQNVLIEENENTQTTLYAKLKEMSRDYTNTCKTNLIKVKSALEDYKILELTDTTKENVKKLIQVLEEKINKTNTSEC